jgi:hypothetical protein
MTSSEADRIVADLGLGDNVLAIAAAAPPLPAPALDAWTRAVKVALFDGAEIAVRNVVGDSR